jgi:hypothetical protein
MPTAYLDDVQEAILAADKNFTDHTEGNIVQHFQVATVNVIFKRVVERWDYGHPSMYRMDRGNIDKLKKWWAEVAPDGVILPAQFKPLLGCDEINVQRTSAGRLFNYHVALTDG